MRRVFSSSISSALLKPTGLTAPTTVCTARLFSTATKPSVSLLACRSLISSSKSPATIFVQTRGMAKGAGSKLDQPRGEILEAIKGRVEEVKGFLEQGDAAGLEQTGFKLEMREEGHVALVREVEGYKVAVVFTPNDAYIPDETQQEGEEGAEGGVQQAGEQGAGEEGEGEGGFDQFGAEPFLAFEVQVESLKNANTGRLIVDLDIDVYGQIHVNGYRFSENRDATEITEEVSKGLESFITQLGVDTELVAYIWSYCRVHHDKSELERLQGLQKFLSK